VTKTWNGETSYYPVNRSSGEAVWSMEQVWHAEGYRTAMNGPVMRGFYESALIMRETSPALWAAPFNANQRAALAAYEAGLVEVPNA